MLKVQIRLSDLKIGWVVQLRNGKRYMVSLEERRATPTRILVSHDNFIYLDRGNYYEDMTYAETVSGTFDIDKVFVPKSPTGFNYLFKSEHLTQIWCRSDISTTVELRTGDVVTLWTGQCGIIVDDLMVLMVETGDFYEKSRLALSEPVMGTTKVPVAKVYRFRQPRTLSNQITLAKELERDVRARSEMQSFVIWQAGS